MLFIIYLATQNIPTVTCEHTLNVLSGILDLTYLLLHFVENYQMVEYNHFISAFVNWKILIH
jgi:hypothetical protein